MSASTTDASESSETDATSTQTETGSAETETGPAETETETETGEPEPDPEPSGTCSLVWHMTLDSDEGLPGRVRDIALDDEDNVYLAGVGNFAWLAKYDSAGELVWISSYEDGSALWALALGPADEVYAVGTSFAVGTDPPRVLHVDGSDGELVWTRSFPDSPASPGSGRLNAVARASDDTLFIGGERYLDFPEHAQWLVRLSALDGSEQWSTTWVGAPSPGSTSSWSTVYSILPDPSDPSVVHVGGQEAYGQTARPYMFAFSGPDDAPDTEHLLLDIEYAYVNELLRAQSGEFIAWVGPYDGGKNTLLAYDIETDTRLWTRAREQLEHSMLGLGLGPEDVLAAAQYVDEHTAAVRMWDADGDLLCINDEDYSTGEDFIVDWHGGVGPTGSAVVTGIANLGPNDERMHIGRFALD